MLALLLLKKYPTVSIDIGYEKDVLIVKIVAKKTKMIVDAKNQMMINMHNCF